MRCAMKFLSMKLFEEHRENITNLSTKIVIAIFGNPNWIGYQWSASPAPNEKAGIASKG